MNEKQTQELADLMKKIGAKVDPKVAERNWNRAVKANRK